MVDGTLCTAPAWWYVLSQNNFGVIYKINWTVNESAPNASYGSYGHHRPLWWSFVKHSNEHNDK